MCSIFLFTYQIWEAFYFSSCSRMRKTVQAYHFHCLKEPGKIIFKLESTGDAIVDTYESLSNFLLNRGEHLNQSLDSIVLKRLIQYFTDGGIHGVWGLWCFVFVIWDLSQYISTCSLAAVWEWISCLSSENPQCFTNLMSNYRFLFLILNFSRRKKDGTRKTQLHLHNMK